MKISMVKILLFMSLCILWNCSENKVAGNGGGMETTNGIAGYVVDENGPVVNALVTLVPADFDPSSGMDIPDSLKATTDSNGYYRFDLPQENVYNVLISNPSNNTSAIISDYKVVAGVGITQLPEGKLEPPSNIQVSIKGQRLENGGKVYIPGTQIVRDLTPVEIESGVIELESVPVGLVREIVYKDSSGEITKNIITAPIDIKPADTLVIKPIVSGIEGYVWDLSGPIQGAKVHFVPKEFDPSIDGSLPEYLKTTSDSTGYFFIKMPLPDTYNITAYHPSNGSLKSLTGFEVHKDSVFYKLPNLILETGGSVEISLVGLDEAEIGGSFYIPGTEIIYPISGNDMVVKNVLLSNLSTGNYDQILLKDAQGLSKGNILKQKETLISSQKLILPPLFQWDYKVGVKLDSQTISQNVTGPVDKFPVLLRLGSTTLDFTKAHQSGNDLRFITSNNQLLKYEIESWDVQTQTAAVWVKLDSVSLNSEYIQFTMHYGKALAVGKSSGSDVFESSNHFTGVYHLNESNSGIGSPGVYKDATGKFDGDDLVGSDKKESFIGPSEFFDGDDYVDLPPSVNYFETANPAMSISGWFNADSLTIADTGGQGLRIVDIHRSDTNGSSIAFGVGGTNKLYFYNHSKQKDPVVFNTIISANRWYHFSITYDGTSVAIYLDGKLEAGPVAQNILQGGTYRAKIGKYGSTPVLGFVGSIDEIRISNTPRSESWIKLSYENQKIGSTLIHYIKE